MLLNADYVNIAIPIIFNQLKKYRYPDTIFDNIRDNLAAFFSSIALEELIVERILLLNQKFINGKITLEKFNELVKQGNKEFSNLYGTDYTNNYVKLKTAIEKFKYLLKN